MRDSLNGKLTGKIVLPVGTFIFVFSVLSILQLKLQPSMLLSERFIKNSGWIQIILIASYASIVAYNMHDIKKSAQWRKTTWLVFSVVFFLQLVFGLLGAEKFLMTGKLHFPIPMMILGGTLYRMQVSFMPILFISTIILTGPSWCSHLCYFGVFDYLSSTRNKPKPIKKILRYKFLFLLMIVIAAITLRFFNVPVKWAACAALLFGIVGILVIVFITGKKGQMIHCVVYCPVGTIVNFLKYINPFRIRINRSCNLCMRCTSYCRYNALKRDNLEKGKPGLTCTYCGDCLVYCNKQSIEYRLFRFSPVVSRNLYLFITISVHAIFLALARI